MRAHRLLGAFDEPEFRRLSSESLSRVASIDWMLSLGLQPIGFALAGPAAEAFGFSTALAAAAVWGVASTAVVLAVPSVRNLPRKEGQDVDAA